jgi:hypothetical protein
MAQVMWTVVPTRWWGFDENLLEEWPPSWHAATVALEEDNNQILVIAHEAVDNAGNSLNLLSVWQMQANNVKVDTTRFKAGVIQQMFEPISGRVIPLGFQGGMYRIRTLYPTDQDVLILT